MNDYDYANGQCDVCGEEPDYLNGPDRPRSCPTSPAHDPYSDGFQNGGDPLPGTADIPHRDTRGNVRYGGSPAIDVKVRLYCGHDRDAILDTGGPDFLRWWDAQESASHSDWDTRLSWADTICAAAAFEDLQDDADYLFPEHTPVVYQDGRSGGWAVVTGLPDTDEWDAPTLKSWHTLTDCAAGYVADFPARVIDTVYHNMYLPERDADAERDAEAQGRTFFYRA